MPSYTIYLVSHLHVLGAAMFRESIHTVDDVYTAHFGARHFGRYIHLTAVSIRRQSDEKNG